MQNQRMTSSNTYASMNTRSYESRFLAGPTLIALLLLPVGCSDGGNADVYPTADVANRSAGGFNVGLRSINGTYGAGCRDRTGSWSLEIDDLAELDHPALSVVNNDTDCVLTLTELVAENGLPVAGAPSIAMTDAFQVSPSSFQDAVLYFANAKLSSLTYQEDFTLSLIFSDHEENVGSHGATLESSASTATAASIPAPNYTLDLTGITLQTDAGNVVLESSGTADLTLVADEADGYAVVEASGLTTYAAIDAAYQAADVPFTTSIPAAAFTLMGTDLTGTQVRSLIIANIVDGVHSYRIFEVTFHPSAA